MSLVYGVFSEPYTSRGVRTVLGGVCANLPLKDGKAALSYSTSSFRRNSRPR